MLQKSSLPYFYSEDDDIKEERGKGDSEEKEKKEGDRRVGVYGGVWMMKRQGRGGAEPREAENQGKWGWRERTTTKGCHMGGGKNYSNKYAPAHLDFKADVVSSDSEP